MTSGPLHGYVTAMFTLLANHNLKWLQLNWIEVHGSYGTARVTAIASMASGCRVMYIHVKLNPKYIHSYGTALVTLVAGIHTWLQVTWVQINDVCDTAMAATMALIQQLGLFLLKQQSRYRFW